ncbi:MAG: hopanoid-associated sugar epimerase, partial [Dehalococcoidia bacterium]
SEGGGGAKMKVLVTGATGFIGGNVARTLLARGYQVRTLVRPESSTLTLRDTRAEQVHGDVRDRESVARALEGCQAVFHCAALYAFDLPDPRLLYETNVTGTRVVLEEARRAQVERVVYTSTVSTIGLPGNGTLGREELEPTPDELVGHYKRSKWLAEQEARRFAREGLAVVTVNPTAPVGPWDVKPTPTGRLVLDFLLGRMPAYIATGMNLVDVEDVAVGHVLALEKGQPGQRYLLGHRNMTLREVLETLAQITGRRAPRIQVPLRLALALGYLDQLLEQRLLRRQPRIPLEGLKVARKPMYVDCQRAVQELGLPQSPVEGALEKAVRWFRAYGYA